jgi:prepilin-type N-terminal cleavage/methylation domain-containing protein
MMLPRLRFAHKSQRGFTLIELIIAITVAGLITAGITYATMQILTINSRASNRMIAVRQVQQAGKEVSKDALQAQTVNATGTHGFPLILTWDEWGTNQTNTVVYDYDPTDMPGGLKKLRRTHTINGTEQETALPIVAEYIDPDQTTCSPPGVLQSGDVLTFNVTAVVGTQSETRVYEIEPRPGS